MAKELDVSPWEALTLAVRVAAARVEWVDAQLRSVAAAADGEPTDPRVLALLDESRRERTLLARTAKAAIDAGVAERLVRQVELEGKVLADALDAALTAIGADPDRRVVALEAAHASLTATVDPATGTWSVAPRPPAPASGPTSGDPAVPYVPDALTPEEGTEGPAADPPPDVDDAGPAAADGA